MDLLISLTATFPALFVALFGALFGLIGDRLGFKRVLFAATLLYAVFGIAPMWLDTLPKIVLSRAFVGITEAAIMTCGTALIVTLFADRERERYLALQTGTAPMMAVVITLVGGALGGLSWRGPCGLYAFAFVLVPLTFFFLWDPVRSGPTPVLRTRVLASATIELVVSGPSRRDRSRGRQPREELAQKALAGESRRGNDRIDLRRRLSLHAVASHHAFIRPLCRVLRAADSGMDH